MDFDLNIIRTIQMKEEDARYPEQYPEELYGTSLNEQEWQKMIQHCNNATSPEGKSIASGGKPSSSGGSGGGSKALSSIPLIVFGIVIPLILLLLSLPFCVMVIPGVILSQMKSQSCIGLRCNDTDQTTNTIGYVLLGIGGTAAACVVFNLILCCFGTVFVFKKGKAALAGAFSGNSPSVFNSNDVGHIVNTASWSFLQQNSPFFLRVNFEQRMINDKKYKCPTICIGRLSQPAPYVLENMKGNGVPQNKNPDQRQSFAPPAFPSSMSMQ